MKYCGKTIAVRQLPSSEIMKEDIMNSSHPDQIDTADRISNLEKEMEGLKP